MGRALWAIVRIDHFLEDLPELTNPLTLVTVTRIYEDERVAAGEVARLSLLQDEAANEYFVIETDLRTESPGGDLVVLLGVEGYLPGGHLEPGMVRLGGVFESTEHPGFPPSSVKTAWGVFTARLGRRKR